MLDGFFYIRPKIPTMTQIAINCRSTHQRMENFNRHFGCAIRPGNRGIGNGATFTLAVCITSANNRVKKSQLPPV